MSSQNDWKYYNHAMISMQKPWEDAKIEDMSWRSVKEGYPLFARWTSDFDCKSETEWWYCIKDTPFNVSELKAKRRYEINKGKSNFLVKPLNTLDYLEDLVYVMKRAFECYPLSYRPEYSYSDDLIYSDIKSKVQKGYIFWGAFDRKTNMLSGFTLLSEDSSSVYLLQQKVVPEYEKCAINAALITGILEHYEYYFLNMKGYMIIDGQRNVSHKTAFQDYLIKYFGFRKAFCVLHIKYRYWVKGIVCFLYPFRKKIHSLSNNKLIGKINGVLKMEEVRRSFLN